MEIRFQTSRLRLNYEQKTSRPDRTSLMSEKENVNMDGVAILAMSQPRTIDFPPVPA